MQDAAERALFEGYQPLAETWDEFFHADQGSHAHATAVIEHLERLGAKEFRTRQRLADATFLRGGITFSVYSDRRGAERIFPFDLIPRVIDAARWERAERGLIQRVQAINAFLSDVYGDQRILDEGLVPRDFVLGAKGYLSEMRGVRPPGGVYVHIAGIDLIQGPDGEFLVLEDNARTPSGVSYVLENRSVMKKVFPRVFAESNVRSVEEYPLRLVEALSSVSPSAGDQEGVAVLTPGAYNSAYFEHSFLARRMGVPLVEGRDLFVDGDRVYAKTTHGPRRIDVIYRRIDDPFLDPETFRKDSLLGVPGLVGAYAKGNVALANAIGNGVADDKGIYPFVPDMIRFYLSEEPILGQVRTYVCARDDDRRFVQENLASLVVKSVNEAGGYGMLIGPQASRSELADFRARIDAEPRNFIAQPRIELSTCPTWTRKGIAPRRVDLRPYVLTGTNGTWVMPGGLTRVALVEGSYVVNSSQGGGSKDTWVLRAGGSADARGEGDR